MKKYEKIILQLLSMVSLVLCQYVNATAVKYTPAELTTAAEQWVSQQLPSSSDSSIQISVSALDNRIGDKQCDIALEFSLSQPITQRQNTIVIRCAAESSWQLYVPVRVDEVVTAVVMTQNLTTGSLLSAEMLTTDNRERRFIRGSVIRDPALIIGARSKRALSMGQVVTLQDLCLVCKGDVVTITVSDSGLSVTATGIAQSDGSLGDTISVLNKQSGRAINAEVIAVNSVRVKF